MQEKIFKKKLLFFNKNIYKKQRKKINKSVLPLSTASITGGESIAKKYIKNSFFEFIVINLKKARKNNDENKIPNK